MLIGSIVVVVNYENSIDAKSSRRKLERVLWLVGARGTCTGPPKLFSASDLCSDAVSTSSFSPTTLGTVTTERDDPSVFSSILFFSFSAFIASPNPIPKLNRCRKLCSLPSSVLNSLAEDVSSVLSTIRGALSLPILSLLSADGGKTSSK